MYAARRGPRCRAGDSTEDHAITERLRQTVSMAEIGLLLAALDAGPLLGIMK